jgi:hypothetical protein
MLNRTPLNHLKRFRIAWNADFKAKGDQSGKSYAPTNTKKGQKPRLNGLERRFLG